MGTRRIKMGLVIIAAIFLGFLGAKSRGDPQEASTAPRWEYAEFSFIGVVGGNTQFFIVWLPDKRISGDSCAVLYRKLTGRRDLPEGYTKDFADGNPYLVLLGLGSQGWELVTKEKDNDGRNISFEYILKRPAK